MADITHHYKSSSIEIHTPAEHTIDGAHPDLELQIIHEKKNSDQKAVVSILFSLVDDVETAFNWYDWRRSLQASLDPLNQPH